ncbi:DHS-like NAD/FAD-binding domain-containing protein [Trametes coccinea BRFM310]|uniref:DHS-like NAD/FAD-binding domain-containing protein n=1 Tax=Trametes coccinea (strain BRFM310) TaxID=1353009 RepID=A0A1Y2IJX4_TRAC3|nr:DHS-like NAD/FAD-binding domain-containing protein [Trametes coccinea BRFM310]
MNEDIEAFRNVLKEAKRVVVVAGAGLSAASGIPTFRGRGGHWRKHDVLSLSTPAAFIGNPSRSWQFHHYLRETMFKASPNEAHLALARFALPQLRKALAPEASFTLITQNIDGLDRRAIEQVYREHNVPSPLSSSNSEGQDQEFSSDPVLLEMHGHIAGVLCTSYQCRHRELNFDSPICPALAGTELLKASSAADPDIPVEDLPRCRKCGALTRPDLVFFTEVPHHIDEIMRIIDRADVCIVVGTSAVVHPAATFSAKVKEHGGTVAVINLENTKADANADFVFLGPCEEILPRILALANA